MPEKKKNPEHSAQTDKTAKKKRPRRSKKSHPVKKLLAVIGTTILSLVLVVIITGSIIAAALTVYVLQFVEQDEIDISLSDLDLDYTTFIYGYDK
ncbi:MAG: penicillin-binding protein, partial [Oscillospiraceae bacterium]